MVPVTNGTRFANANAHLGSGFRAFATAGSRLHSLSTERGADTTLRIERRRPNPEWTGIRQWGSL
jgi:hypothetical protein